MPQFTLTDRFCAGAKAGPAGRVDYFDEKSPGLALRVSPGGLKAWTVHFTSPKDGKRARLTLGSYPAVSLISARTRASEARQHLAEGRDPRDVFSDQAAGAMTVEMLIQSFVEKHVRPNLRTAKETERRFEKNIVPFIGSVRLADLHRRDINRVVDPILRRGRPTEASHAFEDMRALLRWGVSRGDLDRNPAEGMKAPAKSAPRERVLADAEVPTIWNGLGAAFSRSITTQRIVKLCLITAQRVGEVCGIDINAELDMPNRVWTIPAARAKNGFAHRVPLSDLAISVIEEALAVLPKGASFLFPDDEGAGPFSGRAIAKNIARAQKVTGDRPSGRFGLPYWTAHDLRRTAVSKMAEMGVTPIVLGHVINHRSVTKAGVTLSVYSHYDYAKEKRAALDMWADRLAALIKGDAGNVVPMRGVS